MNEAKIAEEILLKHRADNIEKEMGLTETEVIVNAMMEFRTHPIEDNNTYTASAFLMNELLMPEFVSVDDEVTESINTFACIMDKYLKLKQCQRK